MNSFPKKVNRYLKWSKGYLVNYFNYLKYKIKQKNAINTDKDVVWIDFRTNFIRRNMANVVFWFTKAGYKVYLRNTFRFIGSMASYEKMALQLPNVYLARKKPPKVKLALTNRVKKSVSNYEVIVSNKYWLAEEKDTWHVPEGMHPYMYYNNLIPDLSVIREKSDRRIGIFFSGTLDKDAYNLPVIKEKFQMLSRHEVLDTVLSEMKPDKVCIPGNREELYHHSLAGKIVLNDRNKVSIDQSNYISFLSECNFYLYTPGVTFPLCHNNFESMSVGCIPILQYPNFHFPNLTDGENGLVFNSKEELITKINEALSMDKEDIIKMRKNVLAYYDAYLSEEAIIKNIEHKVLNERINRLVILED